MEKFNQRNFESNFRTILEQYFVNSSTSEKNILFNTFYRETK